jgi:hypothetical protein
MLLKFFDLNIFFNKIGQFILDYCLSIGQKCRIICAEPDDLIAYYAYARVVKERDEENMIGYQISDKK